MSYSLQLFQSVHFGGIYSLRLRRLDTIGSGVHLTSLSEENNDLGGDQGEVLGLDLESLKILLKLGVFIGAMLCCLLVFACKRVLAVEGLVNAKYGVIEQWALLLRNAWPKTNKVSSEPRGLFYLYAPSASVCLLIQIRGMERVICEVFEKSYRVNNLSGKIPNYLQMLMSKSLSVLSLHANNFDGDIPFSFPEGYGLQSFNLYGNKLEGLLPRSLMNCSLLEVLNFGDNKIANLRVLVLRSNGFHGFVVSTKECPSFPKLRILDLFNNYFFGPFPVRYIENFKAIVDHHRDDNFSQYMMTHGTHMASTTKEVIWLRNLLHSFGIRQSRSTPLYCDHQAAHHIVANPVFPERTKHLEIDCHLVREKFQAGIVSAHYQSLPLIN
ncbi:hypothetical protein SLEP1_g41620 [Rubroshorea leprosula]|uniref:Uncharacterized protein n=1 Tax=Rubroshorea leprosula TaxID=152421 RepID=A0AAV5L745_9ROSI|nr:hypothetical protein SLEP1_g41620 [Rubroshorea leprosula]